MNTTELLTIFRAEVQDTVQPYLWSDELVYGYIDDAQKQFCRDTYGIADARSFRLSIKADGTEWYKLDPRIIKLRSAYDSSDGKEIELLASEKMSVSGRRFDGAEGRTKALVLGLEDNTVRTWPKPNVAMTIELRTFRMPSEVGAGDDLEIDPQHHRYLLHWVKHLAYDVQDSQTYDKQSSDKYRAKWDNYCAKSKLDQSRARRPVSTVTYGGI